MRFEHEGIALWFGTPDAPAPSGTVVAEVDSEVIFTVGMQPADASNRVDLHYRVNGSPKKETLNLRWWRNDPSGMSQYFRIRLPASTFRAGDTVEYTAVCYSAGREGRSKDEEQEFAASFRVTGAWGEPHPTLASRESPVPKPFGIGSDGGTGWPVKVAAQAVAPRPLQGPFFQVPTRGDRKRFAANEAGSVLTNEVGGPLVNPEPFTVRGRVLQQKSPVASLVVRAFDQDLRHEELLGTTIT